MDRGKLILLTDVLAFLGFVALTASGVLMRYVLPPGSGRFVSVWGLDRHAWGTVHFWIAVGFLAVLAFHLILHWRWILGALRGRARGASGARFALGVVGLCAVLALAAAPFISTPVKTERPAGAHGAGAGTGIRGAQRFAEVAAMAGVSPEYLVGVLGLPADVSPEARLGTLLRTHGLRLGDVRAAVARLAREQPSAGAPTTPQPATTR